MVSRASAQQASTLASRLKTLLLAEESAFHRLILREVWPAEGVIRDTRCVLGYQWQRFGTTGVCFWPSR